MASESGPLPEPAPPHPAAPPPLTSAPTLVPGSAPGQSKGFDTVSCFGDYELLQEIGRGGMGIVYKAWHLPLRRLVALKLLRAGAQADRKELARFRTEAEALARLQHPNIVQVHEVGEQRGQPFIALEFVDGSSLAQELAGRPQPARPTAELVATLARAMHCAHRQGIVHRDLKPANILLAGGGHKPPAYSEQSGGLRPPLAELTPKITDFGLAKLLIGAGPEQTQSGAVVGTPGYMSPEQAGGKSQEIGPSTDVYALGAILYEMMTGRPPFLAEKPLDTLLQILAQEPVPPRRLQPKAPRDLETVCLKCLEKDPRRRYASADELAGELHRFLHHEPIRARPLSGPARLGRWCRRNPALAALIVSVTLLLLFLGVGLPVAALLRGERNEALTHKERAEHAEAQWRSEHRRAQAVAHLAQARADRWSGRFGQRFRALKELAAAAKIQPSLELRNEAIACMTLTDLRVAKEWSFPGRKFNDIAMDHRLNRVMLGYEAGDISIRGLRDKRPIARLPGEGIRVFDMKASSDGRFLAATYLNGNQGRLLYWDLNKGRSLARLQYPSLALGFSPDDHFLAAGQPDKSVVLLEAPSGKVKKRLPVGQTPLSLCFHPNGRELAVSYHEVGEAQVWDLERGAVRQTLRPQARVFAMAWHPEGEILACGDQNYRISLWDAKTGKLLKDLPGHRKEVMGLAFNHRGNVLASWSWDGTTRLWDPGAGKQLASAPGHFFWWKHDDRQLAFGHSASTRVGMWDVAAGDECTTYSTDRGRHRGVSAVDISPDGRLMIAGGGDGIQLWDLATGRETAFAGPGAMPTPFCPRSGSIFTQHQAQIHRWPVRRDARKAGALAIGPPQAFGLPANFTSASHFSLTREGRLLAAQATDGRIALVDLNGPARPILLQDKRTIWTSALSPDGRWLATAADRGPVRVWDVRKKRPIQELPALFPCLRFSPDGQWLVVGSLREYSWWKVGSWQRGLRLPREGTELPGPMAFSGDSKVAAIAPTHSAVRLLDTATWREVATLDNSSSHLIAALAFSPDGSRLVSGCESHVIHVWDLARIRRQLAAMSLDWE